MCIIEGLPRIITTSPVNVAPMTRGQLGNSNITTEEYKRSLHFSDGSVHYLAFSCQPDI